jgi:hypothetical protein
MKKILTSALFLLGFIATHAQYMSFFGDSTWEYRVTYITQPPEEYQDYPPEQPNQLGVYCRTRSYKFRKDSYQSPYYESIPGQDSIWNWDVDGTAALAEDTVLGRIYDGGILICDMSLTEGDTFIHKGMCWRFYDGIACSDEFSVYRQWVQTDTIFFNMKVDSVRYVLGRKIIYLSLLDHLEDYFFGTGNGNLLSDYHLSIRFIEGIGPTYGLLSDCLYATRNDTPWDVQAPHYDWIINLHPWLGLMQCLYKDDSLVYMAHEGLGCDQTCVGLQEHSQLIMNLYPNPATQYVVLDMNTGEEMNGMVIITDMMGRHCMQQKAEGTNCRISVSDLPTGMYFLTYTDGNRKVTRKFLKG